MSDYDETNRGSIWKNDKKETEKHPDYTGSLNVDGVDYWVSAWRRKEGDNPKAPALRFAVKRKDAPPVQKASPNKQNSPAAFQDMDDDLPAW